MSEQKQEEKPEPQITSATEDTVTRNLARELTIDLQPDEYVTIAKEAAELNKEIEVVDQEFTAVRVQYRERLEKLNGAMDSLLSKIREGKRTEVVECKEIRDYAEGKVSYFIDEKLVEERAMTGDELQKDLFARNQQQDTPSDAEFEKKGKDLFEESAKPSDVQDVIREETSKHTKHNSVDGPMHA